MSAMEKNKGGKDDMIFFLLSYLCLCFILIHWYTSVVVSGTFYYFYCYSSTVVPIFPLPLPPPQPSPLPTLNPTHLWLCLCVLRKLKNKEHLKNFMLHFFSDTAISSSFIILFQYIGGYSDLLYLLISFRIILSNFK